MAEVLSQSQIDALLNAARSGSADLEKSDGDSAKKYRKYDFYSPRKFTKDRLKMLNGVFDNYARQITSRLNGMLHSACTVEVDGVEEQHYYEFSNALTEGDVLTVVYTTIEGREEETPVLVHLTTPIMLSMMDRMMGGEGAVDENLPAEYSFTDLELILYENVLKSLVSVMGVSWESYIPLEFRHDHTETNPTIVQLIGLDETVVLVDLNLKFPNSNGRMSVCLPGMLLTNIFAAINRKDPHRHINEDNNSKEIFGHLRGSSLEITVQLAETQLQLDDIYHLNVGDVIDLNQSKNSMAYLNIGGQRWFNGRIGVHEKNIAVKIGETYYKGAIRSE